MSTDDSARHQQDEARYQQKLAARKAGATTAQTYPSNPNAVSDAIDVDAATARYHAKLAARAKAEAKAKVDAAAGQGDVVADPAPDAKVEAPAPKTEAEGRDQGRRR